MSKKNISVLAIIFFTLIMAVSSIVIARSVKDNTLALRYPDAKMLHTHYTILLLIIFATAFIIITQAIHIFERKPDMYKYDLPLAMMSECAEQIKLQESKNELYAAVVQTLSDEYETLYFVDTENEDYLKYTKQNEHNILWLDKHGHYFFTEIYRHLLKKADKNDIGSLSDTITKDNILSVLAEKNTFAFKFRSVKGGITSYYILKGAYFINAKSKHIVIGTRNITNWIQSENEYKEAVGQAIEMAVIDDMTGVKNRNSYVKHEHELEMAIEQDKDTEFALIVLDVNGLKHINDTLGHKAGDNLLKKASALIREVFEGNDIYRIGGDEFAVILVDDAYDDRYSLLDKFRARIISSMNSGDVVIASGLAEYTPGIDPSAESVFDRADAAMYENKIELKSNRRI